MVVSAGGTTLLFLLLLFRFGGLWVYASAVKLKSEREQGKGKERAAEIGRIDLVSPLAANGPNKKAVPGYASL